MSSLTAPAWRWRWLTIGLFLAIFVFVTVDSAWAGNPSISSVSPGKVSASGVTELTITGAGFDFSQGTPKVIFYFGGANVSPQEVDVKYGDETTLVVPVPEKPAGCNGTIPYLKVKNPDGNTSPLYKADLVYIDDPVVSNVFPKVEVTVTGYVLQGGYYTMQFTPSNPNREIYLQGANLENVYKVLAYRVINGRDSLAEEIPISAANRSAGMLHFPYKREYMDGYLVKFKVLSYSQAAAETQPVDLSKIPVPSITSFDANPEDLIEGMPLRMTGTGFVADTTASGDENLNQVIIDQITLEDQEVKANASGTSLTIVIPNVTVAGSGKSLTIRTLHPDRKLKAELDLKNALTIYKRPADLKICLPLLPNRGGVEGEDKVLVAVQGYDENTRILIGGKPVLSKRLYPESLPSFYGYPADAKVLEVVTPPSDNRQEGRVDVRVENARYPNIIFDEAKGAFLYTGEGQFLQVTDISEVAGPASGGQPVTLEGNFVKMRSKSNSQLYVITDGRYQNGEVIGTPVAVERDANGEFNLEDLTVTGDGLFLKEVYPNYPLEGNTVTLVIYSQLKAFFGSSEAQINALQNFTDPQKQILKVVTGPYTLSKNELFREVEVKVHLTEYMFVEGVGQFIGPPSDLPFTGFDTCDKKYTYRKALTSPEIVSLSPERITWRNVGKPRSLVLEGWDFYSGLTVYFTCSEGTVSLTDNGKNMTIEATGEKDSRGRFKKRLTILTPPDLPFFNQGITRVQVFLRNWDAQESDKEYLDLTSAPKIDKVSPSFGPDQGGARITLSGSDFYYGCQVSFKGPNSDTTALAENVRVLDQDMKPLDSASTTPGTYIVLDTPNVSTGPWTLPGNFDIVVVNPDGGSYSADKSYTYYHFDPFSTEPPVINSINPTQALLAGGQNITIQGSNFKANAVVTIDGAEVTGKSIKPQVITGKIPKGSRANVTVPVQVINPDGGMAEFYGFMYYEQMSNPKIISITPDHGTAGIKVVIKGSDFSVPEVVEGYQLPGAEVTFEHELLGTFTFTNIQRDLVASEDKGLAHIIDKNTIELIVPEFEKAGKISIKVRNRDNVLATTPLTFYYQVPIVQPTITNIDPVFGSVQGGNLVTVTGTNFLSENLLVLFGENPARIVTPLKEENVEGQSLCSLKVETPRATRSGKVDVVVVNYDGGYAVLPGAFEYKDTNYLPVVTSITPASGPAMGGQAVTIKGKFFQPVTTVDSVYYPTVTFGGVPAIIDYNSYRVNSETLVVTTPPYSKAGKVDVIVTNPDGGAAKGSYTYTLTKPSVTQVFPDNVANKKVPTYKIIKGTGFMTPQSYQGQTLRTRAILLYPAGASNPSRQYEITEGTTEVEVALGIKRSLPNIQVISEGEIRLVLPSLASEDRVGNWTLRLVNPDGAFADTVINYVSIDAGDLPQVKLPLEPSEGSVKGGTLVTINGTNLSDKATVLFGGIPCPKVTGNGRGTQLVVTTPAGRDPEDLDRKVDVVIVNPDGGQCYLPEAFTYRQPESQPLIEKIEPATGPTKGGTEVTIKGSGFKEGVKVFFDAEEITTVMRDNSTAIRIVTPKHAPGAVDVTVRNPDFGQVTKAKGFTYQGAPEPEPGQFKAEVVGKTAVRLSWPSMNNVNYYEILARTERDDAFQFLASTSGVEYYWYGVKPGHSYYFQLRAVNEQGASSMIEADPYPLKVTSSDLEGQPASGQIEDFYDRIGYDASAKRLRVVVGREIIFSKDSTYLIKLDDRQKEARSLKLIIPAYVVEKAKHKNLSVVADAFKLYMPLRSFDTFEYQKIAGSEDKLVEVELAFATPGLLESVTANGPRKAVTGFELKAKVTGQKNESPLTYFAAGLKTWWKVPPVFGNPQIYVRDKTTKGWSLADGSGPDEEGYSAVNVMKPDIYIVMVPKTR